MTPPPEPRWVPSSRPPIPSDLYEFYWGSEKLFVLLSHSPLRGFPVPEGLRVKFPWFAGDLSADENPHAGLTITGRRLDAPSAPPRCEGPQPRMGYATKPGEMATRRALSCPP